MRKIFASIMALATIVGCSEGVDNVMPTTPDANLRYVAMEVELGGEQTRVFDENLKWSWESDDMVVGAQLAGDAVVANTLTLRESGKFGCDEFAITTEEAANFLFAYPAEGFDATTESLVALQEGVWSPASAGFAQGVTVDNVGSVALKHLSAAFEIRVYDESGSSAKQVKSAQLTSQSDFVGSWKLDKSALAFTQSLSGKELSLENLSSSVVVFNVAEGDFEFTLTLTDSDNNTITLPLSQRNFVAGKRTILNVKWKSVSLDGATSWYEQIASGSNDSNLEGGYIYLTNYNAAGGNATVYVDGSAVTVTDNKIKVASGTHTVYAELAGIKTNSYTVTVTGKPSASFTAASSYNNNSGAIIKNNTLTNGNEGRVLTISNISVSIADEDKAYFGTPTVVYGGSTTTSALSKEVAVGAYDCYLKLPLSADDSKFAIYNRGTVSVTGVPYTIDPTSSDVAGWIESNTGSQQSRLLLKGSTSSMVSDGLFYFPGSVNVRVDVYCAGYHGWGTSTLRLYVNPTSGSVVTSGTALTVKGDQYYPNQAKWATSSQVCTMTNTNNEVSIYATVSGTGLVGFSRSIMVEDIYVYYN